jgi:hypothetical protein
MSFRVANIILNDSPSKNNRDLTDFLKRNMEFIIKKARLTFNFQIIQPSDIASLRERGIKKLPALVINNQQIIGVPEIINTLMNIVKNSNKPAIPKNEEEVLRDYQMNALGNVKKDADGKIVIDEDDEDERDDFQGKLQAELERRKNKESKNTSLDKKQTPKSVDRTAIRDGDTEDMRHPTITSKPRVGNTTANKRESREDNVDMSDAFESLKRISKGASGEDKQDDDMVASLLARMGGD